MLYKKKKEKYSLEQKMEAIWEQRYHSINQASQLEWTMEKAFHVLWVMLALSISRSCEHTTLALQSESPAPLPLRLAWERQRNPGRVLRELSLEGARKKHIPFCWGGPPGMKTKEAWNCSFLKWYTAPLPPVSHGIWEGFLKIQFSPSFLLQTKAFPLLTVLV